MSRAQPFTEEQLKNAIITAIMDDRWSGKRSPEILFSSGTISTQCRLVAIVPNQY
jgi:hypothetical protein